MAETPAGVLEYTERKSTLTHREATSWSVLCESEKTFPKDPTLILTHSCTLNESLLVCRSFKIPPKTWWCDQFLWKQCEKLKDLEVYHDSSSSGSCAANVAKKPLWGKMKGKIPVELKTSDEVKGAVWKTRPDVINRAWRNNSDVTST